MKKYWRNVLPVCLLLGLQACSQPDRNGRDAAVNSGLDSLTDTTQRAQAITADVDVNGDGKAFVLNASAAGLLEVEAANLAIKKSKDKKVKDYAASLLKDYASTNEELNRIAAAKGIQPAKSLSGNAEGDLKVLNTLANQEFDLQYVRMSMGNHQKMLQFFTDGSRLADPELKAFAVKALPLVEQHFKTSVGLGQQ